jgi:hypothetical protein
MFAEIKQQAVTKAASRLEEADAGQLEFWGISISEIIKVALEKALELGREYRDEIEQGSKSAIDAVVALDLPFVPAVIEATLDEATRAAGYAAIVAILDAVLGKP